MKWTREDMARIVAMRHSRGLRESEGPEGFIDLHIRITPEMLEHVLALRITRLDGTEVELTGLTVDTDGLAYPETRVVARAG